MDYYIGKTLEGLRAAGGEENTGVHASEIKSTQPHSWCKLYGAGAESHLIRAGVRNHLQAATLL
eukprot:3433970-Rhodomonas_salina.1